MASLRDYAECVDAPGDFSVLAHFYGFRNKEVPDDPGGRDTEVSLLERLRLLDDEYYNLNVIRVGWDQFSDSTRDDMHERADFAVYRAHEIYAQEDIGVGRVRFASIDSSESEGLHSITTDDELDELTDEFSVGNDGLDLFIPFNMNISSGSGTLLGRSEIDGPCEKEYDEKVRDASVVGPWATMMLSRTFSHELGHYLGLSHPSNGASNPMRLMTQTGTATSNGGSTRNSINLTNSEGNTCKNHCSIHEGC